MATMKPDDGKKKFNSFYPKLPKPRTREEIMQAYKDRAKRKKND